jgi:hypothetical protein
LLLRELDAGNSQSGAESITILLGVNDDGKGKTQNSGDGECVTHGIFLVSLQETRTIAHLTPSTTRIRHTSFVDRSNRRAVPARQVVHRDAIRLTIFRDGERFDIEVILARRGDLTLPVGSDELND